MAPAAVSVKTSTSEEEYQDRRRARELYKYFRPTEPELLNIIDPVSNGADEAGAPRKASSPNVTLTAYAQYIAIRLNAQRALISLLDAEKLYGVAEATRTINISNPDVYSDDNDQLWAGCQTVPKEGRLCAYAVALQPPDSGHSFFEVKDLSKDERFSNLSFVKEAPHFRYYAGMTLVTDNRINIGTVFVLDNKPRKGLDDEEKEFLGTMSTVIVSYLSANREAMLQRKSSRLTQSLRLFGEGGTSFVLNSSFVPVHSSSNDTEPHLTDEFSSDEDTQSSNETLAASTGASADSKISRPMGARRLYSHSKSIPHITAERHTMAAFIGEAGRQQRDRMMQMVKAEKDSRAWAMARAANLIREGLDLDEKGGVVFLDANQDFMRLVDPDADGNGHSSLSDEPEEVFDAHSQAWSRWGPPSENAVRDTVLGIERSKSGTGPRKMASLIAASTAATPFAVGDGIVHGAQILHFPALLLQRLFRRRPSGRVWAFNSDGTLASGSSRRGTGKAHVSAKEDRGSRTNEIMLRYFPKARHLIFVPLWDAGKSQWSAGCFVWNTLEMQLLDADTDLLYVEAITRAVMMEISRLETMQADQQKSDFIGSISHELRSPLHGILASLEFLHETSLDTFQGNLVSTVERCGRTLLDTINHVLDYSKINSFDRKQRSSRRQGIEAANNGSGPAKTAANAPPLISTYASVNIATILEEVVDGVIAGQQFQEASIYGGETRSRLGLASHNRSAQDKESGTSDLSETSDQNIVNIDLDIEPGNWQFLTQPGALRRCFMNIFGNALKYTEHGSITISLRLRDIVGRSATPQDEGRLVIFQVSDTGRGISAQFLRSKIYMPFAQEDNLAPGTGLGLSLVRSIVSMLNGRIDIESRLDRGTTVTIAVPLSRTSSAPPSDPSMAPSAVGTIEPNQFPKTDDLGLTISIFSIKANWQEEKNNSSRALRRAANYIHEWFKLSIIPWDQNPLDADVVIVEESNLLVLAGLVKESKRPNSHLICICRDMTDEFEEVKQARNRGFQVHTISKPFGPCKLGKILRACQDANLSESKIQSHKIPKTVAVQAMEDYESELASTVEKLQALMLKKPDWAAKSPALANLGSLLVAGNAREQEPVVAELPQRQDPSLARRTPLADMTNNSVVSELPQEADSQSTKETPATNENLKPLLSSKPTKLAKPLESANSGSRQPRILLVEDNKINMRLLQTFMKKRGLKHFDSAENGKLALDAVKTASEPFDIIFMDISMPVMNGFEATSAIRAYGHDQQAKHGGPTPSTKIVALTGLASAEDQMRAQEVGMDLFLIKPVSFKEVARLLDEWASCNA